MLIWSIVCVKVCQTCSCVFNRMLTLLRENFDQRQFNGVVDYDTKLVQAELHLDASLTGMGEIIDNQCYALPIPKIVHGLS